MYKNKNSNGKNNLCGPVVAQLRRQLVPHTSQRALAAQLQLLGLDIDKNAVQRIESGERFVTDIELHVLAEYFGVTADELIGGENRGQADFQ